MFSFKKKPPVELSVRPEDLKDRLFFHDMINQTHGLILFLNQKEISHELMDQDEMKMLAREIKTLQSLIRDHFDYKHKNLVQTFDWVPFSYAKLAFHQLIHTYFTDPKMKVNVNFQDESSDETFFYYPSFYRILNNVIKNIAESKSADVEFKFFVTDEGLKLETKNSMNVAGEKDIPEYLSTAILDEKKNALPSLGLESIHHLASKNGGEFTFEIKDHNWYNCLYLPSKKTKSLKSAA